MDKLNRLYDELKPLLKAKILLEVRRELGMDARRNYTRNRKGEFAKTGETLGKTEGKKQSGRSEKSEAAKGNTDAIRNEMVEHAMLEIANGENEATIKNLRDDLEQFGGTNDVTIVKGNLKKGLIHIENKHGYNAVAPVLDAMANGSIEKYVAGNKTVRIRKGNYAAILSLDWYGKRKTWLLTGFEIFEKPVGDSGKVSARHASTRTEPILSRLDAGATSFDRNIKEIWAEIKKTKLKN